MSVLGRLLVGLFMGFWVAATAAVLVAMVMRGEEPKAAGFTFFGAWLVTLIIAALASRPRYAWGRSFLLLTLTWAAGLVIGAFYAWFAAAPLLAVQGAKPEVAGPVPEAALRGIALAAGAGLFVGVLILLLLVLITVLLLRSSGAATATMPATPWPLPASPRAPPPRPPPAPGPPPLPGTPPGYVPQPNSNPVRRA